MSADPQQFEGVWTAFAVHQHQIGPQMAVAAVAVLPLHGMIHVSGRQRHIGSEEFQGFEQGRVEMHPMHAPLDSLEIAPEELLWDRQLPAAGQATPLTYLYEGRQYVVIYASGNPSAEGRLEDSVLAFAVD